MVVYNLNPSISSALCNCKQFVLPLNNDEFLKDPISVNVAVINVTIPLQIINTVIL